MISKNLFIQNKIQPKNFKNKSFKILSKKFDNVFLQVKSDIKNNRKTINVLDNKLKFNFNIKDLKKFKNFRTVTIIGMGGSILGSEAIYNFLNSKLKKKIYFFNDLDESKIIELKKKKIYQKHFLLLFQNQATRLKH